MIIVKVGGLLGRLLEAVYQPHNVEADVEIEVPVLPGVDPWLKRCKPTTASIFATKI
jgi:hypothetical protein